MNTGVISEDQHQRWFASKLSDPNCLLFIVEHEGVPVGQLRLDLYEEEAEISIALTEAARGNNIGRRAIMLARDETDLPIVGLVKHTNISSQKMLVASGYTLKGEREGLLLFIRP